jgi:hypothetical protein
MKINKTDWVRAHKLAQMKKRAKSVVREINVDTIPSILVVLVFVKS